jgi:PAS domain S-box-containing protein
VVKTRRSRKRDPSRPGSAAGVLQRLRQIEKRYEVAMGAINESVYDWNISEDSVYFSDGMERVLGLPPETLKSFKDWYERIHPDDFGRFREATVAHLKGATTRLECDYRYRALDGTWHWARTHGLAIRNKQGRAIRMIGSTGDITELKTSEERYALATSAAVEGIYEWNVQTGELFLSDRAKAFFAFPGEALTPAAWNRRIHGDDFPAYRAAIIDHFKAGRPHIEHEYRIADGQGGYKWVLDRGIGVRDAYGRVTKVVGALSDITPRKQAELELRRARDQAEEALAQQTATAEILKATLSSPHDVQQVFQAILTNASRLCEASFAGLFLYDGGLLRNVAQQNASVEFEQVLQRMHAGPSRETTTRRCALERRTIHTADLLNDPEFSPPESQRRENVRTALSVPMLREGVLLGVITLWRAEVRPFTDRQIALVQTFADQAVIAIENVRLFNETKEALERQTATAEILSVISSSPTDTQPVFEAIVQSGLKLFSGAAISVALPDGDRVRAAAVAESDPGRAQAWRNRFPFPLTRDYMHGVSILDCRVVDVPDVENAPVEWAAGSRNFLASGYRAITIMPMMRGGAAIGALSVVRLAPGPLSEKQLAALKTFADQAVIAIENVRLLNETKESLEQQKASGEVLRAISSSIADTAPVFDKILESCERLFAGRIVGLNLVGEDGLLHIGAFHGAHREEFERIFPLPATSESGSGLCIVERRVVHYPDAEHGAAVPARTRQGCKTIGIKSVIFAPMLWEGRGVGAIFVGRDHVSSFSEKEIALLKTFADQAVIAVQNARLFREIHDKSRQLEVANRHKSEFLANMSHELRTPLNAIIGFTRIVMRRSREQLEPKQYENLDKILASAHHLLGLINAILDLAKVEAGRVELNAGDVQLPAVLDQCLRTVEPLVKADAVSLLRDFDGALPQMYVDEEKLRQIVINLLSNAAKFTARGSIRLEARAANGSVAIAVADTGIGIAADKLELIFEEFEQADASSTRVHGGTGLGLAIARRLARLMGGDIRAQSTPGSGSTFTLTLPVRCAA